MARALIAVGVGEERAYELARADRERSRAARRGLGRSRPARASSPSRFLARSEARRAIRRLRRYRDLQELDLPIILLIGGATGTGKSTVATEVAYRLGITRVTSTDFVRQTMRAFFARTSCRRSTTRASRPARPARPRRTSRPAAARLPRPDAQRPRRRRGRDRARARGGLVDGARGRPPRAGHARRRLEDALVVHACSRSTTRRRTRALLDPRRHVGRDAAGRQVPRPARRHPADPGLHRRARDARRRARDRERRTSSRDRRGHGARARRRRPERRRMRSGVR